MSDKKDQPAAAQAEPAAAQAEPAAAQAKPAASQAPTPQTDQPKAGGGEAAKKSAGSGLVPRVIFGALYAGIIVGALFLGTWSTAVIVSLIGTLSCVEVLKIAKVAGRRPCEPIGLVAAALFPLAGLINGLDQFLFLILALMTACAAWYLGNPRASITDVAFTVFAPIYTSLMYATAVLIRRCDPGFDGAMLTLTCMGAIWVSDAAAYFVGSKLGRHKLAPRISPNKSVEGFWGGLIGSVLIWCIAAALGIRGLTFPLAIICGLIEGLMGVGGDLFESRIKRGVNIKDSGNLIPGHGGMLDRSDSMLFGISAVYFVLLIGGIL